MDNIQLCSLDGNQLKDKKSLYRHNKLHFREGEHICSICKKVFTQKAYLLKHVKQLHQAPSYVCNNCNDTFPNSHNLKRHVESVHQNNSYCCKICGNSYSRKDRLKTHYAKCKQQDEPAQTQNSQNLLEMTEFFNDKPSSVYQKRVFLVIRDLVQERRVDRTNFKKNSVRRKIVT